LITKYLKFLNIIHAFVCHFVCICIQLTCIKLFFADVGGFRLWKTELISSSIAFPTIANIECWRQSVQFITNYHNIKLINVLKRSDILDIGNKNIVSYSIEFMLTIHSPSMWPAASSMSICPQKFYMYTELCKSAATLFSDWDKHAPCAGVTLNPKKWHINIDQLCAIKAHYNLIQNMTSNAYWVNLILGTWSSSIKLIAIALIDACRILYSSHIFLKVHIIVTMKSNTTFN
jgi:hypothetical protein